MVSTSETSATADVTVQRRDMTSRRPSVSLSMGDSFPAFTATTRKSRRFRISSHLARRTVGIGLLLVTVFLWTASNFSTSYVLADQTYDKPFFVVYVNTFFFALSAIPLSIRYVLQHGGFRHAKQNWRAHFGSHPFKARTSDEHDELAERLLVSEEDGIEADGIPQSSQQCSLMETARFGLKFAVIWFLGNYFSSACLEYTSVASVTILTSTSSAWTLIFCSLMRIEAFSARKLMAVVASLSGVILISLVDLSRDASDKSSGSFPPRTHAQIAIGDAMAFLSAIFYGVYVVMMKIRIGDESRVNMPLFFALVGAINMLTFWPLFPILHYTGIEPFEWPPNSTIWIILLLNSLSCLVSDVAWSYAMLLTTPLISTVGLSLTIPLSLIGEMVHYGEYPSPVYWMGAAIVLLSFLLINQDSEESESPKHVSLERD